MTAGGNDSKWAELERLESVLGEDVQDAAEETFLLFAREISVQNIGFIDSKATSLDIDVGKRSYTIEQSPGLLLSDRDAGTTGAVLWKVTPLVATWLLSSDNFLWKLGWLRADSTIIELGCGISGLIALSLAPLLRAGFYALTDQAYVMKVLRQNINANQASLIPGRSPGRQLKIHTITLDWETDAVSNVTGLLGKDKEVDLIVACDCIYNDFLIKPFISTCSSLCAPRSNSLRRTGILIAQQLRSEDVLQTWLIEMLTSFLVFRLPAGHLPVELREEYVIHFAIPR